MKSYHFTKIPAAITHHIPLAVVCVFSLMLPSLGLAAPLPLGSAGGEAECRANALINSYSGSVAGRYPCASSVFSTNTTHKARGSSRATFGFQTGLARVQGSATSTFNGIGVPGGFAQVVLNASASYYVRCVQVLVPPGWTGGPLPVRLSGALWGDNSGNAGYGATLILSGPGFANLWTAGSDPPVPPMETILTTINMAGCHDYAVSLSATCVAGSSGSGPLFSSCGATADPVFEFDQAAFDEIMGEDTFTLADYFTLELSENLVATPLGVDITKFTNFTRAVNPYDTIVPRIAAGETVTWTYEIANMGETPIAATDLLVTDSDPDVTPVLDLSSDDGDLILSPLEVWDYTASAPALDLAVPPPGVTVVPGCGDGRNTYENTGRVEITGTGIFDEGKSHYCNDVPVSDVDSDGIRDEQDNCIEVPNGPLISDAGGNSQLDADGDGYGNICDADLNQDGTTNGLDIGPFRTALGTTGLVAADFNGDGTVNGLDIGPFRAELGTAPGPSCCGIPLP